MKIEIKKIGNSDGLLILRELMQRLDLKRGQQLHITRAPRRQAFKLLPYDPDFERTMEIARKRPWTNIATRLQRSQSDGIAK